MSEAKYVHNFFKHNISYITLVISYLFMNTILFIESAKLGPNNLYKESDTWNINLDYKSSESLFQKASKTRTFGGNKNRRHYRFRPYNASESLRKLRKNNKKDGMTQFSSENNLRITQDFIGRKIPIPYSLYLFSLPLLNNASPYNKRFIFPCEAPSPLLLKRLLMLMNSKGEAKKELLKSRVEKKEPPEKKMSKCPKCKKNKK